MHMSDALVSLAVGSTMAAASTGVTGFSIKKMKSVELSDNRIPMMGVMGAFVFAAQMINFTIPVTGSSGHIGGGILLAALLGPYPAFITLASVLIIQALFFADGGLLALGCNIFNMGFFTCMVAYPLIYKPIIKKAITPLRIMIASVLSAVIGLQLGAFSVVLQTTLSGVTELPFASFLALMQPIHLAIGLVEGLATGAVLMFIYRVRGEILQKANESKRVSKISMKKLLMIFIVATLIIGGFISLYASSNPDGLEWSIEGIIGDNELENTSATHTTLNTIQEKTAFLPDYSFDEDGSSEELGTSVSGVIGGSITLFAIVSLGFLILGFKKIRHRNSVE